MTDTDKPALPAAQVVQSEDRQRKMLQALVDAAAVSDPQLKQRVTIAAAWQYLQLPDSSFGWVPRAAPGEGPPPPLPFQCKALCVITTLALGLTPGLGNVLWLGNKCFVDIYGKRTLAKRAGYRPISRILRPLSEGEREMFALKAGDMAVALEQKYRDIDHETCDGLGYGIVDVNEIGKKPGTQNRKDIAMTLVTRAERDFYNRYFPIDGIADMPDDPRAYVDELGPATPIGSSPDATTIEAALAEPAERTAPLQTANEKAELVQARGNPRREAAARFMGLWERVAKHDADVDVVLDLPTRTITKAWVDDANADMLNDAGDVLEAWLAEREPTPPPSGKKRGRKSNAEKAAMQAQAAAPAPSEPAAPAPAPVPTATTTVEPERFGDEFTDGLDEEETEPAAAPPLAAPPPAAAPRKTSQELELDMRDRAEHRCRVALKRVTDQGGAPMAILGFNPHNRLDDPRATSHELDATADILEKWVPGAPSAVEKNVAAGAARASMPKPPPTDAPPPDDRDAPVNSRPTPAPAPQARAPQAAPAPAAGNPAPRQSHGAFPAAGMISRILERHVSGPATEKLSDATYTRIFELTRRELRADDHLRLPKAFRESKAGNHRGLDELLADRPMLK